MYHFKTSISNRIQHFKGNLNFWRIFHNPGCRFGFSGPSTELLWAQKENIFLKNFMMIFQYDDSSVNFASIKGYFIQIHGYSFPENSCYV